MYEFYSQLGELKYDLSQCSPIECFLLADIAFFTCYFAITVFMMFLYYCPYFRSHLEEDLSRIFRKYPVKKIMRIYIVWCYISLVFLLLVKAYRLYFIHFVAH